jgi:hypothetical protein
LKVSSLQKREFYNSDYHRLISASHYQRSSLWKDAPVSLSDDFLTYDSFAFIITIVMWYPSRFIVHHSLSYINWAMGIIRCHWPSINSFAFIYRHSHCYWSSFQVIIQSTMKTFVATDQHSHLPIILIAVDSYRH